MYNFYIFSGSGKCIYYKEWSRPLNTLSDDPVEERKLMFGMLFSLKDLAAKLSPTEGGEGLHTVKTNHFTLHHFQSVTGMVFVLNSDNELPDQYQSLKHIYANIFVEYVTRSTLYRRTAPDEPIDSPLFSAKLEEFLQSKR